MSDKLVKCEISQVFMHREIECVSADILRPWNVLLGFVRGFHVTIKGGGYVSRCYGGFIVCFLLLQGHKSALC